MDDKFFNVTWTTGDKETATTLSGINDLVLLRPEDFIDMADLQYVYDQLHAIGNGWTDK